MALIVRSWNVFHGNSMPPSRRGHLEAMIRLASSDRPGVLCLQEVPVWALDSLGRFSEMDVYPGIARAPRRPAAVSAAVTRAHPGLLRSWLAGQANAILVDRAFASESLGTAQVSEPGRERRIVQAVRVPGLGAVGNLHASGSGSSRSVPAAELERARRFLDEAAGPDEPRILAGDLNFRDPELDGYTSGGADGIDHVLVSGLPAGPLLVWPRERRVQNGVVLSDHAPVERVVG